MGGKSSYDFGRAVHIRCVRAPVEGIVILALSGKGKQRSVTLGPEYDDATREALRAVLLELGASKVEVSWGVGGSQEIEAAVVRIGGREIAIEAETYVGLTISGDGDLVTSVADRVSQRLRGLN